MPKVLLGEDQFKNKHHNPAMKLRREVLRDTIFKLSQPGAQEAYREQANENHQEWMRQEVKLEAQSFAKVRVVQGDWGDVALQSSQQNGAIYAVLNMANAYAPGGGYLEGMPAQEENMFRRTDAHFYVDDDEMEPTKQHYKPEMTDLIHGVNGAVYLDTNNPRICIKGPEALKGGGSGYADLDPKNYFLFYELRSAAPDLRPTVKHPQKKPFNEAKIRQSICAQLETLKANNVRHVVLSAFGCGAFLNPAKAVARIYKEELEKQTGYFDDVVFAVYYPGFGPDNYPDFQRKLDGVPLTHPDSQQILLDSKEDALPPQHASQSLQPNSAPSMDKLDELIKRLSDSKEEGLPPQHASQSLQSNPASSMEELNELIKRLSDSKEEGLPPQHASQSLQSNSASSMEELDELIKSLSDQALCPPEDTSLDAFESTLLQCEPKNSFEREFIKLTDKMNQLSKDGYKNAWNSAKIIQQTLCRAYFTFQQEDDYPKFEKQCLDVIKAQRSPLDKHRGWSQLFINLIIGLPTAALGVLFKGCINLAQNRPFFFVHRTNSGKILDDIENNLPELKNNPSKTSPT